MELESVSRDDFDAVSRTLDIVEQMKENDPDPKQERNLVILEEQLKAVQALVVSTLVEQDDGELDLPPGAGE